MGSVIYIASRKKIHSSPIIQFEGCSGDASVLSRIEIRCLTFALTFVLHIRYAESYEELKSFLAGLHFLQFVPQLIIIDNLSYIVQKCVFICVFCCSRECSVDATDRAASIVHSLALAQDAADYFTTILYAKDFCILGMKIWVNPNISRLE